MVGVSPRGKKKIRHHATSQHIFLSDASIGPSLSRRVRSHHPHPQGYSYINTTRAVPTVATPLETIIPITPSMSSIVTAVPSGVVQDWCIQSPWFGNQIQQCANATRGTQESDYQTICCDGSIIDSSRDLYTGGPGGSINIDDLVCCRIQGPQAGGLGPPPMGPQTMCASGTPVPLTSLAATNTLNAQDYLVTYTSASFGGPTPEDYIPTETPYCLWANTKSGVAMATVTVPAARITTLSSSSYNIVTLNQTPASSETLSPSETTSAATQSTSTSSAGSLRSRVTFRNGHFLGILCILAFNI